MPKFHVNDIDIYYELAGAGEPLILISGVSTDHVGWKGLQIPAFTAAGYKCLLFDNRDVGQTSESSSPYGIAQFADDTAALIRHLNFGPTHIVAASMGGMIAQELALRHADCVRSLTLVCTTAKPDIYMSRVIQFWSDAIQKFTREEFLQVRIPWIYTYRFYEKTEVMKAYVQRVLGNPYPQSLAGFQRQCAAIIGHDAVDRLTSIRVPTHVVVGAEDILIPPRHSRVLAERITGAKLTVVPDTGHVLFWETPTEFNRAVLDFLKA